jgi:hypothetical protein
VALTNSESENRPTVYLAGPVMSMDDGGAGWREDDEQTAATIEQ